MEREPLIIRGAITAAVVAILHVLVVTGVFVIPEESEAAIAGAIDLVGIAVLVIWTRGKVTPVADPKIPGATVVRNIPPGPQDGPII